MSDADDLQEFNKKVVQSQANEWDEDSIEYALRETEPGLSPEEAEKRRQQAKNAKMWAVYGNQFSPCEKAVSILPAGQFTIDMSSNGSIFFTKREINLDDLINLPDSASEEVIEEIESFWTKEEHFRKFGFLWKRGVMLWGPPGSGKTSTVQMISKLIVDKGGISVYIQNPAVGAQGLELLRRLEPTRPIVVILEDIDSISRSYGEADLLALLDGELQIDNVVFISTTNYPERLDKRLTNRPSRFDIVKKIGMPSADARKKYIQHKNLRIAKGENEELQMWVDVTKGFSIAHIKELIISVEVFEVTLEDAGNRLRAMMDIEISSDDNTERKGVGFV